MSLPLKAPASPRRFWADRRGAFAVSFVILSSFLLSMAAFGLEGSRYITERARLSDAMEQAALALTAEDNGPNAERNYILASDYFRAWMRHDISVAKPNITVLSGTSARNNNLSYVEYRVSGQTLQKSWLSSSFFPSFDKEVTIGDNGAARKYRSNLDVIFVTDFSGSMNAEFEGSTKLNELKRIVLQLSDELFSYNNGNKVGFIPFGWGGKEGDYCDFPFKTTQPVTAAIMGEGGDLYNYLEPYIDITRTVAAIPNKVNDIRIPLAQVNVSSCLKGSFSWKVPLTDKAEEIGQIRQVTATGGTLVSSGVLLSVPYLVEGTEARKVLVIVSDGADDPNKVQITPNLINAGMCDRIRKVLTTDESVGKIAFIGIRYSPTVDWKRCVGENNFYLPSTIKELEDSLRRAVFEEVGHNYLKDN